MDNTQEWRRLLLSVDMSDLRWMAQGIVVNYESMDRMSLIEGMLANRDKLHNVWRAWEIWYSEDDDDAGVQIRAGDGTLVRTIHSHDFGLETRSEPIHYAEQLTDTYESFNQRRLAALQAKLESDASLQNIQEWDKKLRPKPSDPGRVSGGRIKPKRPINKPQIPKEKSGLEYWQEMYRSQLDIFLREA